MSAEPSAAAAGGISDSDHVGESAPWFVGLLHRHATVRGQTAELHRQEVQFLLADRAFTSMIGAAKIEEIRAACIVSNGGGQVPAALFEACFDQACFLMWEKEGLVDGLDAGFLVNLGLRLAKNEINGIELRTVMGLGWPLAMPGFTGLLQALVVKTTGRSCQTLSCNGGCLMQGGR